MFAKERPVSTPKQGKRRATFKNRGICVEHMLELFFFCESQSRAIFNDFQHHLNEFSHFNDSNRSWSGRFVS